MSENGSITLKQMLESYYLVIPDYQRGYAQGRDNKRDADILKMFVDNIAAVLEADNKHLSLDIIYGKINTENDVNIFIPVDGQQRLTTLFLFYVCLYQGASVDKSFLKKYRFNHESTALISKSLIHDGFKEPMHIDSKWAEWVSIMSKVSADPGAKSMLKAYRVIEEKLSNIKNKAVVRKRLENVTFQFVNTENKKQKISDTIFWKMNARGRKLTKSEIFKANVLWRKDLNFDCSEAFDKFSENLFNCYSESYDPGIDIINFDKSLMYIVNIIFEALQVLTTGKSKKVDFIKDEYISKTSYLNVLGKDERPERQLLKGIIYNLQKDNGSFSSLFERFDTCIPKYTNSKNAEKILNQIFTQKVNDEKMRTLLFFFLIALDLDNSQLRDWLRVCANLIWNADSDETIRNIYDDLYRHSNNILRYLSGLEAPENNEESKPMTYKMVLSEEIEKAGIITSGQLSYDEVCIAESNILAHGRIRYLYSDELGDKYRNDCIMQEFNKKLIRLEEISKVLKGSVDDKVKLVQDYINAADSTRQVLWVPIFSMDKDRWHEVLIAENNKGLVHRLLTGSSEQISFIEIQEVAFALKNSMFKSDLVNKSEFIRTMITQSDYHKFELQIYGGIDYYFHKPNGHKYIFWDVGEHGNNETISKLSDILRNENKVDIEEPRSLGNGVYLYKCSLKYNDTLITFYENGVIDEAYNKVVVSRHGQDWDEYIKDILDYLRTR